MAEMPLPGGKQHKFARFLGEPGLKGFGSRLLSSRFRYIRHEKYGRGWFKELKLEENGQVSLELVLPRQET